MPSALSPSTDFSSHRPVGGGDDRNRDEKMPDIPDSFSMAIDKFQCALDRQENDRNSGELINGDENLGQDDNSVSATDATGENDYFSLKILKTEFYEKANGEVAVRCGPPKPLNAESVKVDFADDYFDIVFRTKDSKFLAAHEGTTEETRFRWKCQLVERIVPDECRIRVQSLVEITLKKADPSKKWASLCVVQPSEKSIIPMPDVVASVLPVSEQPSVPHVSTQPILSTKPTCKVPPYNEMGQVTIPGYTGLRNFGNTCFMNAALQALVNTRDLRDYFLEKHYLRDISRTNPLGFNGRLAEAFGQFVNEMWSGMNRYFEPSLLKELVGLKAAQFANFAQHDAQEFLSFLLDGLHEDLNLVGDKKPLTPTVESDGRPDVTVAEEAWRYHLMRNNSVVVDIFHGQLKSRLDCPSCGHTSITFDPFVYLPVPFPKSRRYFSFYFWGTDPYAKPIKYTLSFVEEDSRVSDVFARLGAMINVKPSQFRMIEIFRQKVFRRYTVDDRLAMIRANDIIFVFQVYDKEEVDEDVVELTVIQRQLHPRMPVSSHCAGCGKESQDLRACMKCRTAAYCGVSCQKSDWSAHKLRCRPPSPELVGQPFLISLPSSKVTFRRLVQMLEARARHSVDVFQTPVVEADKIELRQTTSEDSTVQEAVSPSSSETQRDESMDTCDARPTKRVRVVFGEPHQQPGSNPLFQMAVTNEEGEYVLVAGKEKRLNFADDDRPLKIDQGACIAVDWINKKGKQYDHLVVLTKDEMDYVDQPSANGGRANDDRSLNLEDLFEHFTETETLSADDAWYCSRCREHKQAKKTLQLWRLPSVLIVQLKRFVYTSNIFRNKIDKNVVYPIRDFDVRPYMPEEAANEKISSLYDLFAVVCHSGTSFFGHYTGYARLPNLEDSTKSDLEWRSFDDTSVTRVQRESHVIDSDAYFLFYKRRDNPNVKSVTEKFYFSGN